MSLDLYIESKTPVIHRGTGVYVRENGKTVELSLDECNKRYPDHDIEEIAYEDNDYWHGNITHNLTKMANKVDVGDNSLYELLWHPSDVLKDSVPNKEYIKKLVDALTELKEHPDKYKKYNPNNGWGTYEQLVNFTKEFIIALLDLDDFNNYTIYASI